MAKPNYFCLIPAALDSAQIHCFYSVHKCTCTCTLNHLICCQRKFVTVCLHVCRHLLSGLHVMPSQIPVLGNTDMYGHAANKLLQLIPETCNMAELKYLESLQQSTSTPDTSRGSSPLPVADPLGGKQAETPFSSIRSEESGLHAVFGSHHRKRRGSNSSECSSGNTSVSGISVALQSLGTTPVNPTPPSTDNKVDTNIFEWIPQESAYLQYLIESRTAIRNCAVACLCWSSTYSGCVVNQDSQASKLFAQDGGTAVGPPLTSQPRLSIQSPEGVELPCDNERRGLSEAPPISSSPTSSPSITRRRSLRRHSETVHQRFDDKVGLLLKVLLERLSSLLQNTPAINLLLTRVITRLAHYPQPLLCSLLLNNQLVLKPGVPNLFHVSKMDTCTHTHTVHTQTCACTIKLVVA